MLYHFQFFIWDTFQYYKNIIIGVKKIAIDGNMPSEQKVIITFLNVFIQNLCLLRV
jgi:hypothetical protein